MSSPTRAEPATAAGAIAKATPDAAVEAVGVSAAGQPPAVGTTLCANCGAPLTGRYCSECGQRHHDLPIYHFWHFVREATEDLTHADSRLWRTLIALLFRPGFLTREFLAGRRARYLPPVRLYLVVSVIFFIIAGLQSRISNPQVIFVTKNGKSFQYHVVPAPTAASLRAVAHTPAGGASGPVTGLAALAQTPAGRQRLCEQSGTYIEQHGGWLARWGPRVARSCLATVAEGGLERLNQAVEHNLERAMFLLLPLLALAMKPLYLEPPRHYVEHLLFFVHNHAFLFVVFGVATLLEMITSSGVVLDPIDTAITFYIPIYFYRAMRRVYGQSAALTLSKLAALGVAYLFLGIVMFVATFSFSFLTL
jgi:hypothetical protein